jgi:PPOX class probable FMN-dependent enzyme
MSMPTNVAGEEALRSVLGEPSELVQSKIADRLNDLTRQFVERSPFLCLATSSPDGTCDVSPRGDPSGFVRILDERTLLLPDRPGNRLADSHRNILKNPHVALLFVIPGITDTFRVNGTASIVTDPELLEPCAVEGKVPKLGIRIEIEEAFTHCSKAFLRAQLWDPERYVDRDELPSPGELLRSVDAPVDPERYDAERAERYARREGFY